MLDVDVAHTYRDHWSPEAVCRIRVYRLAGVPPVVVATDLVTFEHYRPREEFRAGRWQMVIGAPAWRRQTRGQVEVLIGEPLD